MQMHPPFDSFRLEKQAGEYKDFGADDSYPLKGVTYPVAYGDIPGYQGEDGADLDIFMGDGGGVHGFIIVARPELPNGEHKFYVGLTEDEEASVLHEFAPVLLGHGRYASVEALTDDIQTFRVAPTS